MQTESELSDPSCPEEPGLPRRITHSKHRFRQEHARSKESQLRRNQFDGLGRIEPRDRSLLEPEKQPA